MKEENPSILQEDAKLLWLLFCYYSFFLITIIIIFFLGVLCITPLPAGCARVPWELQQGLRGCRGAAGQWGAGGLPSGPPGVLSPSPAPWLRIPVPPSAPALVLLVFPFFFFLLSAAAVHQEKVSKGKFARFRWGEPGGA